MKYPCFFLFVFFWLGCRTHTYIVCVVRKEAEANETPGATNMEVQRNIDFSSSSLNDIINFASNKPDGERSTTRVENTHTSIKTLKPSSYSGPLCPFIVAFEWVSWFISSNLWWRHFKKISSVCKVCCKVSSSDLDFFFFLLLSDLQCIHPNLPEADEENTPLCHYWENSSFY